MTRRPLHQPTDHGRDRTRWRDLVRAAHAAVEIDGIDQRAALAALALKARQMWVLPAPYPRGLIANPLWSLALLYGRQTDAASRAEVAPLLLAVAGMMDELLAQVGGADASPGPALAEAPSGRLPYRDDA